MKSPCPPLREEHHEALRILGAGGFGTVWLQGFATRGRSLENLRRAIETGGDEPCREQASELLRVRVDGALGRRPADDLLPFSMKAEEELTGTAGRCDLSPMLRPVERRSCLTRSFEISHQDEGERTFARFAPRDDRPTVQGIETRLDVLDREALAQLTRPVPAPGDPGCGDRWESIQDRMDLLRLVLDRRAEEELTRGPEFSRIDERAAAAPRVPAPSESTNEIVKKVKRFVSSAQAAGFAVPHAARTLSRMAAMVR